MSCILRASYTCAPMVDRKVYSDKKSVVGLGSNLDLSDTLIDVSLDVDMIEL